MGFFTKKIGGLYVGYTHERIELSYGPKKTRDAALSGIRRMVKRLNTFSRLSPSPSAGADRPSPPTSSRKKPLMNHIMLVLDASGSMASIRKPALAAFNRILAEIREQARKTGQRTMVGVILFDSLVRVVHPPLLAGLLPDLQEYRPCAMTALWDGVGTSILSLETHEQDHYDYDHSYLVIVVTDGEENSSRTWNAATAGARMSALQKTDLWTFTFQLPRGASRNFCDVSGVPPGNVIEWDATEHGVQEASWTTSIGVDSYYTGRSMGRTSVQNFYAPDLSAVGPGTLAKETIEVTGMVQRWTLDKGEENIRDFCERKNPGPPFLKGAAFYQLMKDEKKVQDYKHIILVEKTTNKVLAARTPGGIRRIMGLPALGTIAVRPGNHANYDIFIQSTSMNRKLPRGTKVIYYPKVGVPLKEGRSSARTARQ